jgi:hypothetical protein
MSRVPQRLYTGQPGRSPYGCTACPTEAPISQGQRRAWQRGRKGNYRRFSIVPWRRAITAPDSDPSLDLQEQRHKFALAMGVGLGKDGF